MIKVGASSMSRYADSQYRASYKSPPSAFRGGVVVGVGVVGGISVIDIERLTRWLDTSRGILVVATAIPPGYRDCRSAPRPSSRLRPNALFSHLFRESATVRRGRYSRHHSTVDLTILYRQPGPNRQAASWH